MPKDFLARQSSRPASQQAQQVQAFFRDAPPFFFRLSFVIPVIEKCNDIHQQQEDEQQIEQNRNFLLSIWFLTAGDQD